MALNKYMHSRNIYRTPPNFSKLAENFPEFASVVKKDVVGKLCIDFKDPKALRVLTKCLLKADFDLDVEIPEDRLVPTLPLRLNYILWIEDLLECIQKNNDVLGLDIGTGACAVYPLLAAVKSRWHMVGTESDEESCSKAQENVERNNLQELITVKRNTTKSIVQFLFNESDSQTYDFCMCNPPFYSSVQELCESRSIARPPPKNAFTGSPQELITEGGELEFIRTLISESKKFPNNIRVYTTMVGHKYNLAELLEDLKTENILYTHTEFCQGRVTRWGLAWSFQQYDFGKVAPVKDKSRKKSAISFLLPPLPNTVYEVQTALDKLKEIFKKLKITYKIINKRGSNFLIEVIAKENTWTNQRQKRRQMKRLETEPAKKVKLDNGADHVDKLKAMSTKEVENNSLDTPNPGNNRAQEPSASVAKPNQPTNQSYQISSDSTAAAKPGEPLVKAHLKLFKKEENIFFEMDFVSGSRGKEGLHQIIQYIKNNWK